MEPSLVACLRLPALPLDAHHGLERTATQPHAVHRGRGSNARVLFVDACARAAGVLPGVTLAAARARSADLLSVPFDEARVERAQREVVDRVLKVSPRIVSAGLRRFWVEPRGPALPDFCRFVAAELAPRTPIALGIGPTATVAYAAARGVQHGARIVPPLRAEAYLDDCPLDVLDVPSDVVDVLAALGIRTVRKLRELDPVSLGMRFGPAVAEARRRVDGIDPRGPTHPPEEPRHEAFVELPEPSVQLEAIVFLLRSAIARVLRSARLDGLGPTEFELALRLVPPSSRDAPSTLALPLRSAVPFTDERVVLESLRTVLERTPLAAPVVAFTLRATHTSPLGERTLPLPTEPRGRDAAAREVAIARLRARLGEDAVVRATHVPASAPYERARFVSTETPTMSPRRAEALPFRRLDPPVPLLEGRLHLGGRARLVLRTSLVERTSTPFWQDGEPRVVLYAHAEVEGPLLVLLRGRVGTSCDDRWEAVAYLD